MDEYISIIANLEQKIGNLEVIIREKINTLEKRFKDYEDGLANATDLDIKIHGMLSQEIGEISTVAYAAFYKTHPGALTDMIKMDEIAGKDSKNGCDPQP